MRKAGTRGGPGGTIGFAHRGARAQAPENTLEAFSLALELGATGLESDVLEPIGDVPGCLVGANASGSSARHVGGGQKGDMLHQRPLGERSRQLGQWLALPEI